MMAARLPRTIAAAALLAAFALPAASHAEIIGHMKPAEALSEAAVAGLAGQEQGAWLTYIARSRALMAADKAALAAERAGMAPGAIAPPPPHSSSRDGGMPLGRPAAWYGGAEARVVALNIVSFQTPAGGWGKNVDRNGPARQRGQHYIADDHTPGLPVQREAWSYVGTIDNDATTTELRFLARVLAQTPAAEGGAYRESFLKGLRYLLNAQYPNGGFPQNYPLEGGYHDAITFNDNAMGSVVTLLDEIGAGKGDYAFVPAALAAEARAASAKAVKMILAAQIVVAGQRTGWCQQHDPVTLAPVGARNFEPPSLTSSESASLLVLLMQQPDPAPDTVAAVRAAAAWLQRVALRDVEFTGKETAGGRRLVAKPGAGPLWSRYYDAATMKPIFGDRDRSIHDDVNAISLERRNGYAWFGNGPVRALETYARWPQRAP